MKNQFNLVEYKLQFYFKRHMQRSKRNTERKKSDCNAQYGSTFQE